MPVFTDFGAVSLKYRNFYRASRRWFSDPGRFKSCMHWERRHEITVQVRKNLRPGGKHGILGAQPVRQRLQRPLGRKKVRRNGQRSFSAREGVALLENLDFRPGNVRRDSRDAFPEP
jgi:hypothetical protein